MNKQEFIDSPSGTIIATIKNQSAFIPNPLPPVIDYPSIINLQEKAAIAIGELNKAGNQLENPYLVIRPLQRQEALMSSSMEGTYTTASALVLADADEDKYVDAAALEVRNYIRAFNYAEDQLDNIPLSNRLIKGVHQTLLQNLPQGRGANMRPGEFKDSQNFIGGQGRDIEKARFIPPPPNETIEAMGLLEKYLNRDNPAGITPLIDVALFHYQFETIHPFNDGNGRVGRIMIPIFLMSKGVIDKPLLFVSPSVEGRKDEYVDSMLDVSKTGNWNGWIKFFLQALIDACEAATKTIARLIALRDDFRTRMANAKMSAKNIMIADQLFISPVLSVPDAADLMKVTYASAKNTVDKMIELEILSELDFTSQPKQFICLDVLKATDPEI